MKNPATPQAGEMERWMTLALRQAELAAEEGEVPIGAVAVLDGVVLAEEHNRSIQLSDPTAHAELLALRASGRKLSNYRLPGVHLYVTVEPCPMCAGALIWSRVERLVFAIRDEKAGAVASKAALLTPGRFNHCVEVVEGVLADPCRAILQEFFQSRRTAGETFMGRNP